MKIQSTSLRIVLRNHKIKAGLVFVLLLVAGLVYGQDAGPVGSQKELPSNPMAGRIVFEEKGCINCTGELLMDEVYAYEVVNNGQDIICETCKWEMKWPLAAE